MIRVVLPGQGPTTSGRHGERGLPGRDFDVRLLPGPQLSRRGTNIALPGQSARLVAFLALHGAPIERGYVAACLAPELDERRASAKLRTTLWRLGNSAEDLVVASGSQLRLTPRAAIDLDDRTKLARRLTASAPATLAALPAGAAAMVDALADDLLLGWYDDWLTPHRERWRQLRLHALEALSDQLRSAGHFNDAVQAALVAAEIDPLRESPQRCIIGCHLAEGNLHQALQVFERFRSRLLDEVGVEPSPLVRELIKAATSP